MNKVQREKPCCVHEKNTTASDCGMWASDFAESISSKPKAGAQLSLVASSPTGYTPLINISRALFHEVQKKTHKKPRERYRIATTFLMDVYNTSGLFFPHSCTHL